MSWRCSFLRRRFVPYLEGEVPQREAKRLGKHLAGCPECGELFERLRVGHQAAQQFARLNLETGRRPPEFGELWTRFRATLIRRGLSTSIAVRALVVLVLALSALLVMSNRKTLWQAREKAVIAENAREFRNFTPLRIAEFPPKTASPVVTEGFVRGVYFDEEEKTIHIKLVELQQKSEPFVICEIRSPGRMAIPQEGNHVRVYGISRYDSQPGRGWNEVNPVTNIDILKR
jgi:hypothetical protein